MDAYGRALGWELDFRQLDSGPLKARAAVLAGAREAALRVRFDRRSHQQGFAPRGFVVVGLPESPIRWCGADAGPGDIINFNLVNGFEGTSGAGFSGVVLLLSEERLAEVACNLGLDPDLRDLLATRAIWRGAPQTIAALARQLVARFKPEATDDEDESARLLHQIAPEVLLAHLAASAEAVESSRPAGRRRAAHAAVKLLEDPLRQPLRVADLCRATGVSAPTLYRGFLEEFGVGPKEYVRSRYLTGVRRELVTAPPEALISEIANRWGFWHMGQFAADYRRKFGELPSQTRLGATG